MPIPTLTPTQQFQNSVNSVPVILNQFLNPSNPQGAAAVYTKLFNAIFDNANGTAAQAVANMGVQAANNLSTLSALYTFLNSVGVTGLTALPAYTANSDGTVTLS